MSIESIKVTATYQEPEPEDTWVGFYKVIAIIKVTNTNIVLPLSVSLMWEDWHQDESEEWDKTTEGETEDFAVEEAEEVVIEYDLRKDVHRVHELRVNLSRKVGILGILAFVSDSETKEFEVSAGVLTPY